MCSATGLDGNLKRFPDPLFAIRGGEGRVDEGSVGNGEKRWMIMDGKTKDGRIGKRGTGNEEKIEGKGQEWKGQELAFSVSETCRRPWVIAA